MHGVVCVWMVNSFAQLHFTNLIVLLSFVQSELHLASSRSYLIGIDRMNYGCDLIVCRKCHTDITIHLLNNVYFDAFKRAKQQKSCRM